jgi:HAD superfamily hydrolase (TIGR01509 family)
VTTSCLLFDFYGTLVEVDWKQVEGKIESSLGSLYSATRKIRQQLKHQRLTGTFPDSESEWLAILAKVGEPNPELAFWTAKAEKDALVAACRPNIELESILETARQLNLEIALASNCHRATAELISQGKLISTGGPYIFSCQVGVAKPDQRFFSFALEITGHPIEECIYVDDTLGNVFAARRLGWLSFHFDKANGQVLGSVSNLQAVFRYLI